MPAIGLPQKIEIYFDAELILPEINTCGPIARWPILTAYNNPRHAIHIFADWIVNSQGFGKT